MAAYLTSANLARAAYIGGVAGLMAVPRILEKANGDLLRVVSAFLLMTIVAGAVTAWGEAGGMRGPFPDWRKVLPWTIGSIAVALLLVPFMLWYDSIPQLARDIPKSADAAIALVLWSAGFETLFFQAGLMSFIARLTGSGIAALAAGPALKLFVVLLQWAHFGFGPVPPLVIVGTVVTVGMAGVIYSRAGLPATMAFNAIIAGRHLLLFAAG